MAEPALVVAIRGPTGAAFELGLGRVIAETPTTVLQEARVLGDEVGLPREMVVKRGRRPSDFGRLDLEQVACERLEHAGLARYFGASRSPELGTALAFEALGGNPLLALNAPGARPRFRDPGTTHYPLPPGIALELAHDVLLALEHVHARGFVHGGVTLTNLLVRTPDSVDGVLDHVAAGAYQGVLAGLGGARELSFLEGLRTGQVDSELTPRLPDAVAAPETLMERAELGGRRIYSPAMDVYAFGLLLYTLLTGRVPYDHLAAPHELGHEVLLELKLRETRGDVRPIDVKALRGIPLHDSPFIEAALEAWPAFDATVRQVILRCVDPDPARRPELRVLRDQFRCHLQVHEGIGERLRPYQQFLFQFLPSSNRLRGDRPSGGLWVREEGDDVLVETRPLAPRRAPTGVVAQLLELPADVDPGTTISVRASRPAAAPERGPRIAPPLPLPDVLRAYHAREPLPVSGPFLLTSTSLDRAALTKARIYSLGSAASFVVATDDGVSERVKLVIGRGAEADVRVQDPMISKLHAALTFDRGTGQWMVQDLRSSNGTRVGTTELRQGKRERLRKSGTKIVLGGEVELTYMETRDLRDYMRIVFETVKAAAAVAKAAPHEGEEVAAAAAEFPPSQGELLEEAPAAPDPFDAGVASAPTRRVRRPASVRPKFPLVRVGGPEGDSPLDLRELARRLAPHAQAGARFRIVLAGAIVERADSLDEALAFLREAGPDLKRLEAVLGERRVVLYSRGR